MQESQNRARSANRLSVGAKETDKVFAKNRQEWIRRGGATNVQADLIKLKRVRNQLKGGKSVTGSMQGKFPDWWRSVSNPEAIKMREDVHSVVQKNLRIILGTQFTEREGRLILQRSWNEELPEEYNLEKIEGLIDRIETGAAEQMASNKYWEANDQTLAGYQTAGRSEDLLGHTEPAEEPQSGTAFASPMGRSRKRKEYKMGDTMRKTVNKNGVPTDILMKRDADGWIEVAEPGPGEEW